MSNSINKRWIKKHLSDSYVKQAKKMGFRSRAAFKLLEIDEQCSLIRPGLSILDLGASPGSWSQVVSRKLKKKILKIRLWLLTYCQLNILTVLNTYRVIF